MALIVVIPDGLLKKRSISKNKISKTYKAVLDLAIEESKKNNGKIILLPANSFDSNQYEQDWAKDYLLYKNIDKNLIYVGISNSSKYITTRDNFILAIKNGFLNYETKRKYFFDTYFKEGDYSLVTSHLHIDRVILILKILSFKKPKIIRVSYSEESKEIVARLFHYRIPILKMIYEIIIMSIIIFENMIKNFLSMFD